jgi:hypothetical protein
VVLASVLLIGTRAASQGDGIAARGEGTAAMARRLEEIAAAADPLRNTVLNARRAALLRERYLKSEELDIGFALTSELLKAGETEEALDRLRLIREAIEGANVPGRDALLTRAQELLAVGYLRGGEQGNCLRQPGPASCLFPIAGTGVHRLKQPARAAARIYQELLEKQERPSYIWLLNLAAMSSGDYPQAVPRRWRIPSRRFESEYPMPRFTDVAARAGVNRLGTAGGSVMEDLDGDGDLDLMTSSWGLRDQMRYYRNDGNGRFTDRTAEAGLLGETGGLNLIHADYDNDGDADVLVMRGAWLYDQGRHPSSLLMNRGDGTFEDVTEKAGLLRFHPTGAAAWGDYDGDGWLDVFFGNESTPRDAHPCELFRNKGDGTFVNVASEVGLAHVGFVKGAVWGDYDRDDRPDLFLSRFGQPNVLFHNDGPREGSWKFTDVTARAGVAEPVASFPAWFWDFDNDGWQDLFVASFIGFVGESLDTLVAEYVGNPLQEPSSRVYRNNRDGTFKDVTRIVGLDRPLAVMGSNHGDFDNDGFLDMYLGTGEPSLGTLVPNRMFRNDRGRGFQDVTTAAGVGHLQKGHGVAVGDVDGDGDQDIYCVMGGSFSGDVYWNALYLNPGNRNHWIVVRPRGSRENRSGIGALIEVTVAAPGGERSIFRTVGTGGSFGSSSLQEEIGLGDATAIRALSIRWPASGRVDRYLNLPMDQTLVLWEGRGRVAAAR